MTRFTSGTIALVTILAMAIMADAGTTTPAQPVITTISQALTGEITLSWTAPADACFRVMRATDPNGQFRVIKWLAAGVSSYRDRYPHNYPGTFYYRIFSKTIKNGKPVYSPLSTMATPVKSELWSLAQGYFQKPDGLIWTIYPGIGGKWLFYDDGKPLYQNADGRPLAWSISYNLVGLLEMYRATGDAKYLEMLAFVGKTIMDNRNDRHGVKDEIRNRIMKAWATDYIKYAGGKMHAWLVHSGMITYPLASFVRIQNS